MVRTAWNKEEELIKVFCNPDITQHIELDMAEQEGLLVKLFCSPDITQHIELSHSPKSRLKIASPKNLNFMCYPLDLSNETEMKFMKNPESAGIVYKRPLLKVSSSVSSKWPKVQHQHYPRNTSKNFQRVSC